MDKLMLVEQINHNNNNKEKNNNNNNPQRTPMNKRKIDT
jgi:hypothetical protein